MTETERVNNARGDESALYRILVEISGQLMPGLLAKLRLAWYPAQEREEITHEAVIRLMERMARRGDEYRIKYIRTVLRRELQHQVYDPERKRWGKFVGMAGLDFPDDRGGAWLDDDREAFADLLGEPDGQRIILEIYFARTFKGLVLRLAGFKPKSWIYDNVLAIKSVYKNTRAMKCRERKRGRPSESPGISPLTRILTRPFRSTSPSIQGRP
jgi:DNA-directed RNA polymerase specialized sigma24 family protein